MLARISQLIVRRRKDHHPAVKYQRTFLKSSQECFLSLAPRAPLSNDLKVNTISLMQALVLSPRPILAAAYAIKQVRGLESKKKDAC